MLCFSQHRMKTANATAVNISATPWVVPSGNWDVFPWNGNWELAEVHHGNFAEDLEIHFEVETKAMFQVSEKWGRDQLAKSLELITN